MPLLRQYLEKVKTHWYNAFTDVSAQMEREDRSLECVLQYWVLERLLRDHSIRKSLVKCVARDGIAHMKTRETGKGFES